MIIIPRIKENTREYFKWKKRHKIKKLQQQQQKKKIVAKPVLYFAIIFELFCLVWFFFKNCIFILKEYCEPFFFFIPRVMICILGPDTVSCFFYFILLKFFYFPSNETFSFWQGSTVTSLTLLLYVMK